MTNPKDETQSLAIKDAWSLVDTAGMTDHQLGSIDKAFQSIINVFAPAGDLTDAEIAEWIAAFKPIAPDDTSV